MMLSNINQRKIFLIDGLGALISAFFLGVVLVYFHAIIGMPIKALYALATLACLFAIYSITCYTLFPSNWKLLLAVIALVNTLYCLITIGTVVYFLDKITIWGIAYFIGEIAVIVLLVRMELKQLKQY